MPDPSSTTNASASPSTGGEQPSNVDQDQDQEPEIPEGGAEGAEGEAEGAEGEAESEADDEDDSPTILVMREPTESAWPRYKYVDIRESSRIVSISIGGVSLRLGSALPHSYLEKLIDVTPPPPPPPTTPTTTPTTPTTPPTPPPAPVPTLGTQIAHIARHAPDRDPMMPYGMVRIFVILTSVPPEAMHLYAKIGSVLKPFYVIIDEPVANGMRVESVIHILDEDSFFHAFILTHPQSARTALGLTQKKFYAYARNLGIFFTEDPDRPMQVDASTEQSGAKA